MNGKSCKRMRKHIRNILPDAPARTYKGVVLNQKKPWAATIILDMCQRKFYKQLKRDVKRFRSMNIMPKGVMQSA